MKKIYFAILLVVTGCTLTNTPSSQFRGAYPIALEEALFVEYGTPTYATFSFEAKDPQLEKVLGECSKFSLRALADTVGYPSATTDQAVEARINFTPRCIVCVDRIDSAKAVFGTITDDGLKGNHTHMLMLPPEPDIFGLGLLVRSKGTAQLEVTSADCALRDWPTSPVDASTPPR